MTQNSFTTGQVRRMTPVPAVEKKGQPSTTRSTRAQEVSNFGMRQELQCRASKTVIPSILRIWMVRSHNNVPNADEMWISIFMAFVRLILAPCKHVSHSEQKQTNKQTNTHTHTHTRHLHAIVTTQTRILSAFDSLRQPSRRRLCCRDGVPELHDSRQPQRQRCSAAIGIESSSGRRSSNGTWSRFWCFE